MCRIRYRQPFVPATLIYADKTQKNAEKNPHKSALPSASIRVLFAEPQKAIAPGQSAVFYRARRPVRQSLGVGGSLGEGGFKEHELLGGGIIS